MKRKISTVQLFRHIVQFISFILFPGLFIMAYSSIKSVVMAIVNGTFSIDALSSDIAIMVAVLSITILFGRFFCGFICTFRAMGDLLYYLSGFVLKKHPNINQKVDAALKYVKYVILFALVAFVWILGVSLNESYNPWYIFGIYSNLSAWTSMDAWISVGDDDDKIRLNQRKPSKYKGLSRFGPEKNLQRINKFMKERPIFYKNLIQMKENFRFYLRCFYCITKVVILQFNSENRTELARNG